MKLSYFVCTLPYLVWLCSIHYNEYISKNFMNILMLSCNDIRYFLIKMTDVGTIAMKWSNSKFICQTLNKFGAYIALNLISDWSEFIWCLVAMISGNSSVRWVILVQLQWNVQIRRVFVKRSINLVPILHWIQIGDWPQIISSLASMIFSGSSWNYWCRNNCIEIFKYEVYLSNAQ